MMADMAEKLAAKANALAKHCVHGKIIGWACAECGRDFDPKALQDLHDAAKLAVAEG